MKTILIITIFFCLAGASFAQRVVSSCDAPDSVKKMYREDAAWIVFDNEISSNSPYLDSVIIPADMQEKCLDALLAVYNVVGMPEADSVIRIPLQHDYIGTKVLTSFHSSYLAQLWLGLDTTINWEEHLSENIIPTGNLRFDTLIKKYNISFDTIYHSGNWVAKMQRGYNVYVLDSSIRFNTGIFAGINGFSGSGDQIEGRFLSDSAIMLIYSLGWIDCELGCEYRRFWNFTVFSDCSVQFNGAFTRTPENWSVNSITQYVNDLILYPNPSSGTITIETEPQSRIEILDLQGKILQSKLSQEDKTEMDVSSLGNGTFFVRAINKSGKIVTGKFIKE